MSDAPRATGITDPSHLRIVFRMLALGPILLIIFVMCYGQFVKREKAEKAKLGRHYVEAYYESDHPGIPGVGSRVCLATCVAIEGRRHTFVVSPDCLGVLKEDHARYGSKPLTLESVALDARNRPYTGEMRAIMLSPAEDVALIEADFPPGVFTPIHVPASHDLW